MDYTLLKTVHIVSAAILFGTGIGSAFYWFMVNRRKDVTAISFITHHVVLADWIFTTPAIITQFITGVALVRMSAYSFSDTWLVLSLILFCIAGACWIPVVWLQIKMRNWARMALTAGTQIPRLYWRYQIAWILFGSIAFPAMLGIFYLMVNKPSF